MPFVKAEDSRPSLETRVDAWRQLMSEAFGPMEVHPNSDGKFSGSARTVKRAGLQFNEISYSGQVLERTARNAGKLEQEFYTFGRPTSGPLYIKKKNIEFVLEPGCIYLTDQSVPYLAHAKEVPYQSVSISIPRKLLEQREPNLASFYTLKLGDNNPRAQLLAGYMDQLMAGLFSWSEVEAAGLANKLLDMIIVLMVNEEKTCSSGMDGAVRLAQLENAMAYIKAHFEDPGLNLPKVAESCGLSVNYLAWLFKDADRSVDETIHAERLTKGHELLSLYDQRGKSISQLAYQAGFNHAGHFSRLFKERFGVSPRDFRIQASDCWNLRGKVKT